MDTVAETHSRSRTRAGLRVLIADDHALFREGLREIVGRSPAVAQTAEAIDGDACLVIAAHWHPDVVLLDVSMPGPHTSVVVRRLRRVVPAIRILVLTMYTDRILEKQLVASGADLFLSKSMPSAQLISLLEAGAASDPAVPAAVSPLSPREGEVLLQLAEALSTRDIAASLCISEGTVKRHVGSILSKLDTHTRMQAVLAGRRLGILEDAR